MASPIRSNCDMVSANVAPPKDKGDPGTILGVGLGVGRGVGVGVGGVVGSAGGGVGVEMGPKVAVGRGSVLGLEQEVELDKVLE